MLAELEHKEISSLIIEYSKEGTKVLSQYESSFSNGVAEEKGPYAVIDVTADKHTRKVSAVNLTLYCIVIAGV